MSLPVLPQLEISEVFFSLQGEGASLGAPCTFLRLSGCNLTCRWCDTPYTWDWQRFDRAAEMTRRSVDELARELAAVPRLIITGGEPLVQQKALEPLLAALPPALPIEVETNGTIPPRPALVARVSQWNVSPKLSSGGDGARLRLRPGALSALKDTDRAVLKLVIGGEGDLPEADALIDELAWPRDRVYLMPEATTPARHAEVAAWLAPAAIERRVRFTPRLHVLLWGDRRGV